MQLAQASRVAIARRAGSPIRPGRHDMSPVGLRPLPVLGRRAPVVCAFDNETPEEFALSPSKPSSPLGEMAVYYLSKEPHLFEETVDGAFRKLKEQREAAAAANSSQDAESVDLVLSKRIQEVKDKETAIVVEDLMYFCILDRFRQIGVSMLPQLGPMHEDLEALKALTEGVHTKEAIEMVKEHMLGVLGPASVAYGDTVIKMSKLQSAQVYAASIMFGYFLSRVDQRFQLTKSLGMLPSEDAVERLERLFASAEDEVQEEGQGAAGGAGGDNVKKNRGALRKYVESFDQETMMNAARLCSVEGAALVERQTEALFGDAHELQREMQDAVGLDAGSAEELMKRVEEAVQNDKVQNLVVSVATQRRAILEAVAYGSFLRSVEEQVDSKYGLLHPK
mmetsp:Transcript_10708/g.29737  ORF Transcript_10708/g.29737 Transcript_10708/m.29737 type:complete len:394 (-) Transcript_10708:262-1443(-)